MLNLFNDGQIKKLVDGFQNGLNKNFSKENQESLMNLFYQAIKKNVGPDQQEQIIKSFGKKLKKFSNEVRKDGLAIINALENFNPISIFAKGSLTIVVVFIVGVFVFQFLKNRFLDEHAVSKKNPWYEIFQDHIPIDSLLKHINAHLVFSNEIKNELNTYIASVELALSHQQKIPPLLLIGPPGTGKTELANLLGDAFPRKMHLSGGSFSDLIKNGRAIGELKSIFNEAKPSILNGYTPCLIFIDEIEILVESRNKKGSVNKRSQEFFAQFLTILSDLPPGVWVVGASNFMNKSDKALDRRFPKKITLKKPGQVERIKILFRFLEASKKRAKKMKLYNTSHRFTKNDYFILSDLLKGLPPAEIKNIITDAEARSTQSPGKKLTPKVIEKSIEQYKKGKEALRINFLEEEEKEGKKKAQKN